MLKLLNSQNTMLFKNSIFLNAFFKQRSNKPHFLKYIFQTKISRLLISRFINVIERSVLSSLISCGRAQLDWQQLTKFQNHLSLYKVIAWFHGSSLNLGLCVPAWSACPRANVPKACQLLIFTCQRANAPTCQFAKDKPIFHLGVSTCQKSRWIFNFACQKVC